MKTTRTRRFVVALAAMTLAFSTVVVDHAEARRGGSFGSRGARTYQSAPATNTAPAAAPVQRSMTSPTQANSAAAATSGARSGMFGAGFGGAMMRGLLIGGLFGMLMGHGFGGLAGMLGFLVQFALLALVAVFLVRMFRRRSSGPAMAGRAPTPNGAGMGGGLNNARQMFEGFGSKAGAAQGAARGYGSGPAVSGKPGTDAVGIGQADLDIFERKLQGLQAAFSREDYSALREITTPEVMSYLSEELAQNTARGVRNDVRDVSLLQGDVAESWREGTRDFATVAMRYSMIDTMRDRGSDRVVEGNETSPVESTEVWTFVRERGAEWKLSAIQEA